MKVNFCRWAISRSNAYERSARYMAMICYEFCDKLQATNRNVTGCQYRGLTDPNAPDNPLYNDHIIETNADYGDCLFFKGEEIVPGDGQLLDSSDNHKYTCLRFDKLNPADYSIKRNYRQIHPVDRKSGKWGFKFWVALRLPENDQIKTRLMQIRIEDNLSKRPNLKIEVISFFKG